ncbi:MAG: hypothetical protein V3U43_00330 [Pseudomonadales bacterium]
MKKETKSEYKWTIIVSGALMVVTVGLLFFGVFDDENGAKIGAVEVWTTTLWTLGTMCIGYAGARNAKKAVGVFSARKNGSPSTAELGDA